MIVCFENNTITKVSYSSVKGMPERKFVCGKKHQGNNCPYCFEIKDNKDILKNRNHYYVKEKQIFLKKEIKVKVSCSLSEKVGNYFVKSSREKERITFEFFKNNESYLFKSKKLLITASSGIIEGSLIKDFSGSKIEVDWINGDNQLSIISINACLNYDERITVHPLRIRLV